MTNELRIKYAIESFGMRFRKINCKSLASREEEISFVSALVRAGHHKRCPIFECAEDFRARPSSSFVQIFLLERKTPSHFLECLHILDTFPSSSVRKMRHDVSEAEKYFKQQTFASTKSSNWRHSSSRLCEASACFLGILCNNSVGSLVGSFPTVDCKVVLS